MNTFEMPCALSGVRLRHGLGNIRLEHSADVPFRLLRSTLLVHSLAAESGAVPPVRVSTASDIFELFDNMEVSGASQHLAWSWGGRGLDTNIDE